MKNLTKAILLVIVLFSISAKAQEESDLDRFVNDMLFLADGFASPASESAAYQATAGWFTSARALEKWKVDVSLHGNAIFVPTSKKEFTINNNDFSILEITGNDRAVVPTAFGKNTDVQFEGEVNYNGQVIPISGFDAIDGIDKEALIYPFAQVSVGLPYGTEIGVRALPSMEINGSEFSTYGVGIKHNFNQYFRFDDEENLQVAAILSYNIFDVKYDFDPISIDQVVQLDLIDVSANVWMAEVLASKRYENFEIFGALGVAQSDFEYEFGGDGIALPLINTELTRLNDTEAQFKGDIGFNLYFERFKISTMATAGKFVNVNLGLHFIL
ncbi:hypothetical protein GCM10023115_43240 [Pontixanthobacter gangjinensis]|uniref:PorV/PorQ family protein n=1 Tax=Christiangramia aestuarii TaxID=1028746 RepID=A0A7M3SYA4_9FLAO|nr:DUF6588 family protein [Christiangramia aestuarii]MUP41585.1 hypothetical protein [Christiangramia aestuarii]